MANEVKATVKRTSKPSVKIDATNKIVETTTFKVLSFDEFKKMIGEFSSYSVEKQMEKFAAMGVIGLQTKESVSSAWLTLSNLVNSAKEDYTALTAKGNQAAATRIRATLLSIKQHVGPFRKAAQLAKVAAKAKRANKAAKTAAKAE